MDVRLKTKIIESGKLQVAIAIKVGITDSKLSRIVRGWHEPHPGLKQKIADELNCKITEIF